MEVSQTRAIADALLKLRRLLAGGGGSSSGGSGWRGRTLAELLDVLEAEMDEQVGCLSDTVGSKMSSTPGSPAARACTRLHHPAFDLCIVILTPFQCSPRPTLQGLDALARSKPGNLARPRRFELAAAINRLRTAQLRQARA